MTQGTTWSRIWDWASYPNEYLYYSYNVSSPEIACICKY